MELTKFQQKELLTALKNLEISHKKPDVDFLNPEFKLFSVW